MNRFFSPSVERSIELRCWPCYSKMKSSLIDVLRIFENTLSGPSKVLNGSIAMDPEPSDLWKRI